MGAASPAHFPGIHNVVAYHDGFYAGGVPEGDVGFDTLLAMGVRTVISVDGAEPDLARARDHGLRYVHLPIGYNGFDDSRKLELVRATRDAMRDGPVYLHCHHGKHRAAGAAATIASSLGWMTPEQGVERMKVSGTAPNYSGLYACTLSATVLDGAAIDTVPADFPEVTRPRGFVKSMVELDEMVDHLKAIERAGWAVPADHPDLVPAAEAGRIADVLRVLSRGDRALRAGQSFEAALTEASGVAQGIENGLLATGGPDRAALSAQLKRLNASCVSCHAKFRD